MPTKMSLLIQAALFSVTASVCYAQDAIEVERKALAALTKVENYPAGVVKGSAVYAGKPYGKFHVHFRDSMYWLENDTSAVETEQDRKRILGTQEIMGASKLLPTAAYDGKHFFDFRPYTLTLTVQTTSRLPIAFAQCKLLPVYWTKMGTNPRQRFSDVIKSEVGEHKVEALSDGRWKISNTNIGANIPGAEKIDIRDRYVMVDGKCDFLVTEYAASGSQGVLQGTLNWKLQDGFWYAKSGKQTISGRPWAEWEIDSISFDADKPRTRFDDLEETVPFATRIIRTDEKNEEVAREYKGDTAGEEAYNARELAGLKRLEEGF